MELVHENRDKSFAMFRVVFSRGFATRFGTGSSEDLGLPDFRTRPRVDDSLNTYLNIHSGDVCNVIGLGFGLFKARFTDSFCVFIFMDTR